jgi:diadenosine tetraphosphate (Ap4A) HIT family hydrolase
MGISIPERILNARAGTNPALICRVPSGWAVMCDAQFLRGYTILLADPVVSSINDLELRKRAEYLRDMTLIGDALLEVTSAFRINYGILGNTDAYLHTHIIPRYATEDEKYLKGLPWSYPKELVDAVPFDFERDKELMIKISAALQKRL